MKKQQSLQSIFLCALLIGVVGVSKAQSVTFSYTGAVQTYAVPTGVNYVAVDAMGAAGGSSNISPTPGLGGRVRAYLATTPGQVLQVYVGGVGGDGLGAGIVPGGFNGGGNAAMHGSFGTQGGSGGGATDIRMGGSALANRVLVAGGGGGAGYQGARMDGGKGGGLIGGGGSTTGGPVSALGGTQSAGGRAGSYSGYTTGTAGSLGQGGSSNGDPGIAGGGGGGYYGGGGAVWGGGGGGSSFTNAALLSGVSHLQGVRSGNGQIQLSALSAVAADGLFFDGSNDYVSFGSSITNMNNADFTLELWVNTLSNTVPLITCQNSNTTWEAGEKCLYLDASGVPVLVGHSMGYIVGSTSVNDGNWHHVAVTWDYTSGTSGIGKVYIDGVDRTSSSSYAATVANVGTFNLGRPNFGETSVYYNGMMDEVRIWSRALCLSEVNNNIGCQLVGAPTGLAAYYTFSQGTVTANNAGIDTLTDVSGNGNRGTLTNFALSGIVSNWFTGAVTGSCGSFPGAITGSSSVCEGSMISLSSVSTGGSWSSSNTGVATVHSVSGVVSGLSAGTAVLSYAVSCAATIATSTITVHPRPTAISGTFSVCAGASVTLSNGISGGTWVSSTTSAGIGSVTGVVTGVSAGTTTISYTTTGGCNTSASLVVLPVPNPIVGTGLLCVGLSATLSSSTTGGSWSSSHAPATVGATSGIVTGVSAGTATISYTLPTGCGAATIIMVNSFPAGISGPTAVCIGSVTTLSTSVSGGRWFSANPSIASIDSVSGVLTASSVGATTISYALLCGVRTATIRVEAIPGAPSVSVSGPTAFCSGDSVRLQAANNALQFTGVNYAMVPNYTAIQFASGASFSATGWVYVNTPATGSFQTVFCKSRASSPWYGLFISSAGKWIFGAPSNMVGGDATPGWHHFALVYNGSAPSRTIYIDGVLSATDAGAFGSNGPGDLYIGQSRPGSDPFSGKVDELAIFNTALTATTITNYLDSSIAPSHPNYANLVGYWKFDEGTGTTITDKAGIAPTGTLTGSPAWVASTAPFHNYTGYTFLWSPTSSSSSILVTATGTYSLSVVSPAGCTSPATATSVTVTATPGTIGGVSTICNGSATTLTNAVSGGTWTSSDTMIAYARATTGIVFGTGIGTATITYTNSCGRSTVTVTVIGAPSAAALSGPSAVVAGSTITLSASAAGGTWSSGSSTATVSAGVVRGISAGTAIISYVITNGCGSATATKVLTVQPLAAGTISGPSSLCAGSAATFTSSSTGGTWRSSNTSKAAVGTTTGIVTGVAAGTAVISYIVGTAVATQVVAVLAAPAAINGSSVVCIGSVVTLSTVTAGGSWSTSNASVASVSVASGRVAGVAAGTATISYTVASGCYATRGVTVSNTPAGISGPSAICYNTVVTLSNAIAGGVWASSNRSIASIGSATGIVRSFSAAGNVVITYTMPGGCRSLHTITVVNLTAITGGAGNICSGKATLFANATTGGVWSSVPSSVASVGSTGLVTGILAGTSVISYSIPAGCARTVTVTVHRSPGITSGPTSICYGLSVTLSNPVSGGVWSSLATGIASVGSASGIVHGISPSSIPAKIVYTLTGGCKDTLPVYVSNVSAIGGLSSVCEGQTILLTNPSAGGTWSSSTPSVASVGTAGLVMGIAAGSTTVTYVIGSGCTATKTISVRPFSAITGPLSVCVGETITLANSLTGGTWSSYYTVLATVDATTGVVYGVSGSGSSTLISYSIPGGCVDTARLTVNYRAPITGPSSVCQGTSVHLSNLHSGAGGTWYSSNTTAATITAYSADVYGITPGTTTVSYMMPTGCLSTYSVIVHPAVPAIAGPSTLCVSHSITLTNAVTGGFWSCSRPTLATIDSATGIVTGVSRSSVANIITYSLPATGCRDTAIVLVNCSPRDADWQEKQEQDLVVVPNPNNGEFSITGNLGIDEDVALTIELVNMLGQVVYSGAAKAPQGEIREQVHLQGVLAPGNYILRLKTQYVTKVYQVVVE